MTNATARLFLDTNSFIQLRDLKDLPWRNLLPDHEGVVLLVGPTVLGELETHKNNDNRRRRDRARAAFKLIEAASNANDLRICLRNDGFPVDLALADDPAPDWTRFPKLDPHRPDDRLVAEVATHPQGARLFSHDSGPVIRARLNGLGALKAPDDWMLPPMQTDDQRQIAALTRDLQQARTARPHLELVVRDVNSEGVVILHRLRPPPLDEDQRRRLADMYRGRFPEPFFPPAPTGAFAMIQKNYHVGQEDIDNYRHWRGKWFDNVHAYFSDLHENVRGWSQKHAIDVEIANVGAVSARETVLTVAVEGPFQPYDVEGGVDFSGPPSPPSEPVPLADRFQAGLGLDTIVLPTGPAPPQDPTLFHWIRRPSGREEGRLLCQDLRPETRPVHWIHLLGPDAVGADGRLTISVSAEHHPVVARSVALRQLDAVVGWRDRRIAAVVPPIIAELITTVFSSDG